MDMIASWQFFASEATDPTKHVSNLYNDNNSHERCPLQNKTRSVIHSPPCPKTRSVIHSPPAPQPDDRPVPSRCLPEGDIRLAAAPHLPQEPLGGLD